MKEIARSTGDSPRGVLFPNSFGSALLFKLGGIRSAGYPTDGRGFLLDARLAEPGVTHEVNRFFTVAREAIIAWGGTPARDKPTPQLGLKLLARHRAGAPQYSPRQSHHRGSEVRASRPCCPRTS